MLVDWSEFSGEVYYHMPLKVQI